MHFGVDEPGRDSQRRIMELVRDMQVDVIGLLESDCESSEMIDADRSASIRVRKP